MKKLLLSLALAAASAFSISAETFDISCAKTDWPSMSSYSTSYTSTAKFGGTEWTGKGFTNNSGQWNYLRGGAKSSTKVDAYISSVNPVEYAVDGVTIDVKGIINNSTINSAALIIADNKEFTDATSVDFTGNFTTAGTWTATVASPAANKYYKININYTNTTTKNGALEINKFTFSYTAGQASNVSKPEISGYLEGEAFKVTISAEEGAEVYYTLDGTDPTKDSELYTAPIDLTDYMGSTVEVKAIAVKGDDSSTVSIYNANVPYFLTDFSALIGTTEEDGFNGVNVVINGKMTVIAQPTKNYLYVNCGANNMVFYGSTNTTYQPGDTFEHAEATIAYYGQAVQLTNYTLGEVSAGTVIEPTPATIEDIHPRLLFSYLKLEGVTISGVSGQDATITDATGNSVALRNQFNLADFVNATNCTLIGFVGSYNGTVQFQPTLIEIGTEVVAAPVFNPADGSEVAKYTRVVITAEEGCEIFYKTSQDAEEDPFTEYNEWSIYINGEIGSTFTVEAYAEKDGVKSETVSATYTLAKVDPELAWGVWGDNYEFIKIDEFEYVLGVTTEDELPTFDGLFGDGAELSLTSSDPEVASVNMEDYPWLTVHKAGTTYLTVAVTECEDYLAGEATLKLVVVEEATLPSSVEASFDFTDFSSLDFSTPVKEPTQASSGEQIEDNTLSADGVVLSFDCSTNSTGVRFWNGTAAAGTTLRIYKGATMTFTAPTGYYLTEIAFTEPSSKSWGLSLAADEPGTLTSRTWTATQQDKVSAVTFENPSDASKNTYIASITVKCEKIDTGVANIEAADENAPVEYFNLQGVRVQNPVNGLYIRRQGSNVTKVIL